MQQLSGNSIPIGGEGFATIQKWGERIFIGNDKRNDSIGGKIVKGVGNERTYLDRR